LVLDNLRPLSDYPQSKKGTIMSRPISDSREAFERELVRRVPNAQLQLRDADDEVRPGEYEHATHEFAWQMWQAQAAIAHKSDGAVPVDGFVDIVFDAPPGPTSGRFIEVENDKGESISFGEWVRRPDGYWALRFTAPVAVPVDASPSFDPQSLLNKATSDALSRLHALGQSRGYHSGWDAILAAPKKEPPPDVESADSIRSDLEGEFVPVFPELSGAAPAPHSGGSVSAREDAQRERMKERFADRVKSPATADFDLPAPNDAAPHSGEAATVETDAKPYKKEPITKEWCMNMAHLEGESEIGACDPAKYPASQLQICTSFKDGKAVFVIVRRTSAQHSVITDMGDSFASRSLAESALAKLSGKPVPDGTFACPICGKDTPHEHSSAEVAQHRIDRAGSKQAPIGEAGGVVASSLPQPVLDALRFYANGHHFAIDSDEFDTVSGEPQNWQHSQRDDDITCIEDGSIAKWALTGDLVAGEDEPSPPVPGEVYAAAQPQAAPSGLSDADIDMRLDAVLRSSGSALRHYSMQKSLDDMRTAMRWALTAPQTGSGS
jgi:hypothetical protein